ncbi:hypothetical protein E5S69_17825 [Cupriavidus necator]|uniref:hypothetical protein n=1 Tax=Cupriavidus necator TaxID=106590 RepID=UPI00149057E6|nr:hypothetical protein [Cupriavidus necator]NOV25363.1 hypothetical protein [Cupriavidus necator]
MPTLNGYFTFYPERPPVLDNINLDFATNPILLDFAFGALVGMVYRYFHILTPAHTNAGSKRNRHSERLSP